MPKPRARKLTVDFTGVEAGGRRSVPDGNYTGTVSKITEEEGSESGQPYLKWVFKITGPTHKGAQIYHNTSLQPQALFNLKALLEAMGADGLDGEFELDLGSYIDEEVGFEIVNEEYQGKASPKITAFMPASEVGDENGDTPEEAGSSKPAAKANGSFKIGAKVQFKDEDGRVKKGIITGLSGDEATVDVKGEPWDVEVAELSAAD
jgi:uncharacterized protein DUF669